MVIDKFDIERMTFAPDKTYPPLLIDPYGVLANSVSLQRFQMVSQRHAQVFQTCDSGDQEEFVHSPSGNIGLDGFINDAARKPFSAAALERFYHPMSVSKNYTLVHTIFLS